MYHHPLTHSIHPVITSHEVESNKAFFAIVEEVHTLSSHLIYLSKSFQKNPHQSITIIDAFQLMKALHDIKNILEKSISESEDKLKNIEIHRHNSSPRQWLFAFKSIELPPSLSYECITDRQEQKSTGFMQIKGIKPRYEMLYQELIKTARDFNTLCDVIEGNFSLDTKADLSLSRISELSNLYTDSSFKPS
jgi:hypothetical protein